MEPSKRIRINDDLEALKEAYVVSLSPLAKKGLEIARSHLESSFSLEKSIGFLKFVAEQKKLESELESESESKS